MHDAKSAVECMRRSAREFIAGLEGVSDAQWRTRPEGEEWSLADTAEHVVLVVEGSRRQLERQLLASPLEPDARRLDDTKINAEMFRSDGPAPKLAEPRGRLAALDRFAAVAELEAACEAIARWVERTGVDLRRYGLPHPVFGTFDGVQWILFLAAHTDNHTLQIRVIRERLG